jgi:hypothetical protein
MQRAFGLAVSTLICFSSSVALTQSRQLGAHEHGQGTLNIAIEGTSVKLELEVPGDDIVGFEHAAKTAADKAKLAKAIAALEQPLTIFKVPAAAQCVTKSAAVAFEADAGAAADAHKEFHGNYVLECAAPGQLTGMDLDYFKTFSGAQGLTVNVITSKGQASSKATRKAPRVDLSKV